MYLPILTLRTSGIPKCRIASRTAFPCGSSTAALGITITFAFIVSPYLQPAREQGQSLRISARVRTWLLQKDNFQLTVSAQHIHSYVAFIMPSEQKIN